MPRMRSPAAWRAVVLLGLAAGCTPPGPAPHESDERAPAVGSTPVARAGAASADAVVRIEPEPAARPPLTEDQAERFAGMALACVGREYPNKLAHVLAGPQDVGSPRALTPAFFGCFDWHSAVHGHWLLVRLTRRFPDAAFAGPARTALAHSLRPEAIAGEVAYLERDDRTGFERPYGLAWLLQLAAELRAWDDPEARRFAAALAPLERLAAARLRAWLAKLDYPIRSGEHSQTAFALGLTLDWARETGDAAFAAELEAWIRRMHAGDRECALHLEPSGHDFLSPCLGAADLVRRVLPPAELARWLERALPEIPRDPRSPWLPVAGATDRRDGKLVHLDGLSLSRAWMLEGIAQALPADDPRRPTLYAAAQRHAQAGLAAVSDAHYEGGHWLASFAVYLTTGRGQPAEAAAAGPSQTTPGELTP